MKISAALYITISFTFCLSAYPANSGMKPGLWEHHFTIKSQSGKIENAMADLKVKMANMPVEQRKMMEDMMAKQGLGINHHANSVKVCISKEQAANLEIPQGQNQNCKNEVIKRTAKTIKIKFECKGISKSLGEGEFTLTSPTSYTGKSVVNMTVDNKPDRMNMDQKGKWLSANCGEIKPIPTEK